MEMSNNGYKFHVLSFVVENTAKQLLGSLLLNVSISDKTHFSHKFLK